MAIGKLSFLLIIVSVSLMSDVFWRIARIFSFYEYFLPLPSVNKTKKLLIVGVMSAQHHFKERESVRNTWGQFIDTDLVDVKFLIGSKICPIAPEDRVTPYVCEKWNGVIPQSGNLSTESTVRHTRRLLEGYTGFSFIIKHNISIIKLGLHNLIFKNNDCKRARVILFDAASGDKVASATFIAENYSNTGITWKGIHTLSLPENFEGELTLVTDKKVNISCPPNILNRGVIHVFELQKDGIFSKFMEPSCVLVAFSFFLENDHQLNNFMLQEKIRRKNWEDYSEILRHQLEIENRAYNDILFFDLIDVYKNLTLKLFEFLKWTHRTNGYSYILKTDDDVFLDIKTISYILKLYSNNEWDWWSCFRQNCPPPKYGKWRDRLYSKKYYPLFPSGAGYVISDRIASHIVTKNHVEDITAGEDVALGVWIDKSLKRFPKKLNTTIGYWACGILCSPVRPCNVPQLSWQQLHQMMNRLLSAEPICLV